MDVLREIPKKGETMIQIPVEENVGEELFPTTDSRILISL